MTIYHFIFFILKNYQNRKYLIKIKKKSLQSLCLQNPSPKHNSAFLILQNLEMLYTNTQTQGYFDNFKHIL